MAAAVVVVADVEYWDSGFVIFQVMLRQGGSYQRSPSSSTNSGEMQVGLCRKLVVHDFLPDLLSPPHLHGRTQLNFATCPAVWGMSY